MLLIETNLTADEATLEQLLAALPSSWRARAERYKPFAARLRSAVGYTLLARILRETYGIEHLPAITADEHGKPHLCDCPLYFSISHCKAAVACVVEDTPVAIDVQDILSDLSPALAARIAAPDDPAAMDARALTARWTQKEASAKLDGRGLKIGLERLPLEGHHVTTHMFFEYSISLAEKQAFV